MRVQELKQNIPYLVSTGYPIDARAEKERLDVKSVRSTLAIYICKRPGKDWTLCQAFARQGPTSYERKERVREFPSHADK